MDIETLEKLEKMNSLSEKLSEIENDRLNGKTG